MNHLRWHQFLKLAEKAERAFPSIPCFGGECFTILGDARAFNF
jgi:hypothetical protein